MELGIDAFCRVIVYGHIGPIFECRCHLKRNSGSYPDVLVPATISAQFNEMAEVVRDYSSSSQFNDMTEVGA